MKKSTIYKNRFIFMLFLLFSVTVTAEEVEKTVLAPENKEVLKWITAEGNSSCPVVCKAADLKPVPGGVRKGKNYYVCAGNNESWRPGYNIERNWSNHCLVGQGGKEKFSRPYLCLCTSLDTTGQDQKALFNIDG